MEWRWVQLAPGSHIPVAFQRRLVTVSTMSLRGLISLLMLACWLLPLGAAEDKQEPLPDGQAARPTGIYFQFAVYYGSEPKGKPLEVATALFHKDFAKRLTYRSSVVRLTDGAYVEFREVSREDYAPPKADYLEHKGFGLTVEQRDLVQETATVLVLDFFIVKPKDYDYLIAANELAAAVAAATGGFVWDEETRELFTVEKWRNVRLSTDQFVFANTSVHAYPLPSKRFRTVSFGMRKLGAPDLVIADFTAAFWEPVSEMMRFLVYQVAARGPLQHPVSWTGKELSLMLKLPPSDKEVPPMHLIPAPAEPGDPRNDLLTVDFQNYPGATVDEKQAYAIDRYFRPNGGLMAVWRERERHMALSDQARESLKAKKESVEKGLPDGEQLLIKAFHQEEYQWFRVKAWTGDQLEGERVPNIDAGETVEDGLGDPVRVGFDQVFDYLFIAADGSEEGNETGRFIREVRDADAKARALEKSKTLP